MSKHLIAIVIGCLLGAGASAHDNGWTLTRVSPKGLAVKEPRLIPTKHGLHIAWIDIDAKRLRIAPFDPVKVNVEDAWPTRFRRITRSNEVLVKEEFLNSFDVQVGAMVENLDDDKPTPGKRASFLSVTRRFFLPFDGPLELLCTKVLPREKDKMYELAEFGKVVDNDWTFYRPPEQGGLSRIPGLHQCLLRRATPGGKDLILAVSDYAQIWTTQSKDGGKTWTAHHTVRNDHYWSELVETPDGFLMFCLTKKFELHTIRSEDGQAWTKPEPLFPKLTPVRVPPSAKVDKYGTIWFAFGTGEPENRAILLTRSTDAGKTWSEPEVVTKGQRDHAVSLAFADNRPVIAVLRGTDAKEKDKRHAEVWVAAKKAR